jgi:HK97 gp10 family phage protein
VVKVSGSEQHIERMERMSGPELVRQMGAALFVAGQEIEVEAAHSITQGAVSGKGHIPSLPGEPPNADTHLLDRSIETHATGPLKVQVSSNAPYSVHLELGTSTMHERPYMRPAAQKKRDRVVEIISKTASKLAAGKKVV